MIKSNNAAEQILSGTPLSMVYSPKQEWTAVYDVALGFERGTIFPELDKPFMMGVTS